MTRRTRLVFFFPAAAAFGFLLFWGFAGLPDLGHYRGPYGFLVNHLAVSDRHADNAVNATVYDIRGFDTLGEEFILFAAAAGVVLLLRREGREREASDSVASDAVRVVGVGVFAACLLVGLWLVAFGFITPGGGFQGGVLLAGSFLLLYVAAGHHAWSSLVRPGVVDPVEALGAGGYVVIGLAALLSGLPFLASLLGPGHVGTLLSGGSAPFVGWAASLEVSAALLVVFGEFLSVYVAPLAPGRG